jgi:SAM-dependent methyltransferase
MSAVSISNNLRFAAMPHSYDYSEQYKNCWVVHGRAPDQFILDSVERLCPDTSKARIWDIGCGVGRNAIPLAKAGYTVTGSELADTGRERVKQRAQEEGLDDRVIVDNTDILSVRIQGLPLFDLAFMDRVAQHFTFLDLRAALWNIAQQLQAGGILIFDALVRKPGHEDAGYDPSDTKNGATNFSLKEIETAACGAGLELMEAQPNTESGQSRPAYMDHWKWGGHKYMDDRDEPRPVEHQWFVLKKPDDA